jgi:hypothetical protein
MWPRLRSGGGHAWEKCLPDAESAFQFSEVTFTGTIGKIKCHAAQRPRIAAVEEVRRSDAQVPATTEFPCHFSSG